MDSCDRLPGVGGAHLDDTVSESRGRKRCDRSKSFSAGQRPQPKPRTRSTTQSTSRDGNSSTAACVSADSSPQLSRPGTKRHSLFQPTPLVLALRNQLMSQLSPAEDQQRSTEEESSSKHNPTQKSNVRRAGDLTGDDLTASMENLQLHSKNSPATAIQRQRALSDPKNGVTPARPPLPSYPPPPKPRPLSGLISEYKIPSSVHVIDSRSKTPPTRRPVSLKTTKYGTPPPRRPAPPPPAHKKASPIHQVTPVPKPRNPPVPKPRSSPVPKPQSPQNSDQTSSSREAQQQLQESDTMTTATTKETVDKSYPVYEDLDKDDNNYEKLDPSSSSEDENELARGTQEIEPSFSGETPPALPPKKAGSKIKTEEEELPPLPPRSHPATNVRKHRLLTNHKEEDDGNDRPEEEKEAVQDTGPYEPINYDSDNHSQDSYTEMNDPADGEKLENDEPEDIYIVMDPHEYIPPPESYKPKAKKKEIKAST